MADYTNFYRVEKYCLILCEKSSISIENKLNYLSDKIYLNLIGNIDFFQYETSNSLQKLFKSQ